MKRAIIQYLGPYHREHGETPSVRTIAQHFRISTATLYRLFPGGIAEACHHADVPVPERRIQQAHAATASRTRPLAPTVPTSHRPAVQAQNASTPQEVTVPWSEVAGGLADRLLCYVAVWGADFFTSPTYRKLRAIQRFTRERGETLSMCEIVDEVLDAYLATSGHFYWDGRIVPVLYTPPAYGSPSTGTPRLIWTPP
jgi:hypothetical protein